MNTSFVESSLFIKGSWNERELRARCLNMEYESSGICDWYHNKQCYIRIKMAEENVESIDLTNILENETNKFIWDFIPEDLRHVRESILLFYPLSFSYI